MKRIPPKGKSQALPDANMKAEGVENLEGTAGMPWPERAREVLRRIILERFKGRPLDDNLKADISKLLDEFDEMGTCKSCAKEKYLRRGFCIDCFPKGVG